MSHRNERDSIGEYSQWYFKSVMMERKKKKSVMMVIDGSYSCGEHSKMCRTVELLGCSTETHVTLCANNTSIRKYFF